MDHSDVFLRIVAMLSSLVPENQAVFDLSTSRWLGF
jgi:hypothetical protein